MSVIEKPETAWAALSVAQRVETLEGLGLIPQLCGGHRHHYDYSKLAPDVQAVVALAHNPKAGGFDTARNADGALTGAVRAGFVVLKP